MKQLRKPLSFLLALVMVLGLFALAPMSIVLPSFADLSPTPGAGGNIIPAGGGNAQNAVSFAGTDGGSQDFSFSPSAAGFYTIKVSWSKDTSSGVTSQASFTSLSESTGAKDVKVGTVKTSADEFSHSEVWFLSNEESYKFTLAGTDSNGTNKVTTATVNATRLTSNTSWTSDVGLSNVLVVSNTTATPKYYIMTQKQSSKDLNTWDGATLTGYTATGQTCTQNITPAKATPSFLVPANSTIAIAVATATSKTTMAVSQVGAPGSCHPTSVNDEYADAAGTLLSGNYFQYTPTADGIYLITTAVTLTSTDSTVTGFPTVTVTESGTTVTAQTKIYNQANTSSRNYDVAAYALTANKTYLITMNNSLSAKVGTRLKYPVSLSINALPHVKGTGTASMTNIPLYAPSGGETIDVPGKGSTAIDGGKFGKYDSTYFAFTPSTTGWYTFTCKHPVVLNTIQGANSTLEHPVPYTSIWSGWQDNLYSWDSYTAGASGYFEGGKTYYFFVDPVPEASLVNKVTSTTSVNSSVTISKANFAKLTSGSTKGVDVTSGLAQGAFTYVEFNPSANIELGSVYVDPADGTRLTIAGVHNIQAVYFVKADGTLDTTTYAAPATNTPLTAGTTYYLKIQSGTGNDGKDATKAHAYLSADAIQGNKIWVYSPVSACNVATVTPAGGYKESGATVKLGNETLEPDDDKTYSMVPGATYTITGSAPGCYDRTISFTAGEEAPAFVLYPVPEKGKLLNSDEAANYTFKAEKPATGSNIVKVTINATYTKVGGTGTHLPISIPQPVTGTPARGTDWELGLGTYTTGASSSTSVVATWGADGNFWFNPFGITEKAVWLKVTYRGTHSDKTEVVYQIDISGVSKLEIDPDAPTCSQAANSVVGVASGKAVGTGLTDAAAKALVTGITSDELFTSYVNVLKTSSSLKSNITTAQNELKTLFTNQDKQSDGKTIKWQDYIFAYDGSSNLYDVSYANVWDTVVKAQLTDVVVVPILNLDVTEWKDNTHFTFKITAANRTLVTDATKATAITGDPSTAISNRDAKGTLLKIADLDKDKSGAIDPAERINAIQIGADKAVSITGAVKVTVPTAIANQFVIHTKDSGEQYVYEVLTNGEFVSAHGFSTFQLTDKDTKNYKAYIVRETDAGTCKIWYATAAKALADAETGDAIYLTSSYDADSSISVSNSKATSFVVIGWDLSGGKAADMAAKITVNGTTLNYASISDGTNPSVRAAVFGSGASATTDATVTTVVSPSGAGSVSVNNYKATAGETVTFTATANSGYTLSSVTVKNNSTGTVIGTYYTTTGTFKMPSDGAKVTVTATFTGGTLALVNSPTNGGSLSASPSNPSAGASVTVTATPKTGYRLSSINAVKTGTSTAVTMTQSSSNSSQYVFVMPSDGSKVTVTATWVSSGVTIVNTTGGNAVASNYDPVAGSTVVITATPATGYNLIGLTIKDATGSNLTYNRTGTLCSFTMPGSGGVTVTPTWGLAGTLPYIDQASVNATTWAKASVQLMYDKGIMTGSNNYFNGGNAITRAELWTSCARLKGTYVTSSGDPWYTAARNWSISAGVSDGSDATANITREQLATMLYRLAGKPATSGSVTGFPDAGKIHSEWADTLDAMKWCVEKGILTGDNGNLKPQANATRYEVAVMLSRWSALGV